MSPPSTLADLRHWLATADAVPARWVRSAVRTGARTRARARSGSVSAHMDRIVEEANSATRGSGLDIALQQRSRQRRTARDTAQEVPGDR